MFSEDTSNEIDCSLHLQANTVDCVLRGGMLEVGVSNGGERLLLVSQGNVTLEVWHYVLIELQVPTSG